MPGVMWQVTGETIFRNLDLENVGFKDKNLKM